MRRPHFLGLGSALLVILGGVGPAQADNGPHVSSAEGAGVNQSAGMDRCASCHRTHQAQAELPVTTGRDEACLACHGPSASGATTDVVDGVGYDGATPDRNTASGALRGGGFAHALISSGTATRETYVSGTSLRARHQNIPVLAVGQATTSNHGGTATKGTSGRNGAPDAEADAAVTLKCGSCHDPHGNGNYRVLRSDLLDSGLSTRAVGLTIPDAAVKVYTTTNYWLAGDAGAPPVVNGVDVGTTVSDGYVGNIAQWCTTCHSQGHTEANIMMGGGSCVTCHVAHGSNAKMSRVGYSPGAQPDSSAAPHVSSRLLRIDYRATCVMCHTV